ncbi:MAG: BON domain-containing protein [Terriglobales bacterium]
MAALLAIGACGGWAQGQPQQTMQYPQSQQGPPGSATYPPAPALSDAEIQQSVQSQINADPSLKASGVSATVVNGRAVLMGVVPDPILKKRAAKLAQSVAGVRGVQNLITVNSTAAAVPAANAGGAAGATLPDGATAPPYGPSGGAASNGPQNGTEGEALQYRVTQALASDPVLGRYAITATVNKNNDVVLRGMVPTKMDKRHAENLVKGMSATYSVKNKIKVNPKAGTMGTNAAAGNPAAAEGGVAAGENGSGMNSGQQAAHPPGDTLPSQSASGSGTPVVPSQPEASTPVAVAPGAAMAAALQERIHDILQRDPVLQPYRLTVVVPNPGYVTVEGVLPSKGDREHAIKEVKAVLGVHHINDQIHVDKSAAPMPQDPPSSPPNAPLGEKFAGWDGQASQAAAYPARPQDVRTELQARLQAHPQLSGVVVYVQADTVTLRGNVASKGEQRQAVRVVKNALPKGYRVKNHIAINRGMGNGYPPLR